MNRDKREAEYPAELESQFILKLPEEPAKTLREVLRSGENLKNRFTIQIENDMRHGEVRFDHWLMHAKIVDLPTIIESLKTIDNKSFYKTADICQMMICKNEPDPTPPEEESTTKNKKKDPYKVDKKFLWPHGVTPPTKNVRKRRFRKTLKKKCVEAPEIEKEVKRLLRADNEAVSVTWEVIKEDNEPHKPEPPVTPKAEKKKSVKREAGDKKPNTSNVMDIFGGALSDSDIEDDNNMDRMSPYDSRSDTSSMVTMGEMHGKRDHYPLEFESQMFRKKQTSKDKSLKSGISSGDDTDYSSRDVSKDDRGLSIDKLKVELEELKQRKHKLQSEIAGMENLALKQRFQETLHTLSQEVMYKEMQYQGLLAIQNSDDL